MFKMLLFDWLQLCRGTNDTHVRKLVLWLPKLLPRYCSVTMRNLWSSKLFMLAQVASAVVF
jgi:hypothetical protein